jgi:choline dehydrogenase-like flavoprotein
MRAEDANRFQPKGAYDVCIVGSGAGGAVVAALLAQAGFSVIVLEEGGHHEKSEFKMREDLAMPMLYQEQGLRTVKDASITILQGRAVGGSTVVNWTTSFRTPEQVIDHWRRVHAVGGFTRRDLEPHWDAVEERLNVQPIALEESNRNNRTLWDGCTALGLSVETIRRNTRSCFKSGYCGMGCPVDAKQSMLITYLPDAVDKGAQVVARCRVDRLRVEPGRVTAAERGALGDDGYTDAATRLTVRANRFVLSAGAINSPAVLIRSGLGGGLVGRRTFLHPVVGVASLWKDPIEPFYGAPQSVASHAFADRGDQVGFFLEAMPLHPMLASVVVGSAGAPHYAVMKNLAHLSAHLALAIDGFHPSETGGTVEVRPSGAPLLDYRLPPRIFEGLREGLRQLVRIDLAAGALRSFTSHSPPIEITSPRELALLDGAPMEANRVGVGSAHVMGGCAMGDDPSRSVVRSSDLRHHAIANLHVVDGSVFPTSLGVNPQETIYGLAHLMATRFRESWKS